MAFTGQILENPISGERFTFHAVADDTDGEALVFDLELAPDGHVPGAHVHPRQEERFKVLEGTMNFRKGVRRVTARPGDVVVVPAGIVHRFENAGDLPARVHVEVRPALRMEELFETAVGLARDGRTNTKGMPHPLDLALFMEEFEDEVRAPFIPAALARAAMAPLSWLARRRGLDSRYRKVAPRAPHPRRDQQRPSGREMGRPPR